MTDDELMQLLERFDRPEVWPGERKDQHPRDLERWNHFIAACHEKVNGPTEIVELTVSICEALKRRGWSDRTATEQAARAERELLLLANRRQPPP